MRKKLLGFMQVRCGFLWCIIVLLLSSLVLAVSANATQYYVGDGSDGALTISSTQTEDSVKSNITAQASSGQKNITVNSASGFSSGNWVFVIQIKGTGAGNYEFTKIDSISSNTLTMKGNLTNTYQSTGAQVIKVKQYSSVTVDYGGVWTASAWDGTVGGILVAMVNGDVTLNNDGSITMAGKGFRGGNGKWTGNYEEGLITNLSFQGESTNGDGKQSTSANGQGGGGASTNSGTAISAAGGGGGGYGTSGSNGGTNAGKGGVGTGGSGGETAGVATLENNTLFGGGGGGSAQSNYTPVDHGGRGGGIIIFVVGGNITLNTGNFSVKGNKGNDDQSDNTGGAGGGAGGSIRLICAKTVALRTGIVIATGGAGTLGYGWVTGADGGDGGSGRIATLSSATISGTSNPAIDTSSTDTTTTIDPFAVALPPTVTTSSATNVTSISATLNGTVNANGQSTTAWFNYGITSGTYTGTSTTQSVSGSSNTSVSSDISGLSSSTTYYYRIAASSSAGISYGSEASFTTSSEPTPTPTPTPSPSPSPSPSPTPTCTDDYEPNDSFSTAYGPLTSGNSYNGKICSASDVDYFKITADSTVTISLTLEVPSDSDYDLYLYDALQDEVAHSQQDRGVTEEIQHDTSTTGTYYIEVIGFDDNNYDENQTYTLSGTWTSFETPIPTLTLVGTPPPTVTPTPCIGDIAGQVTDATTGGLIGGATVSYGIGTSRQNFTIIDSATTNAQGAYAFQGVDCGDYVVAADANGYSRSIADNVATPVTVVDTQTTRVDFALEPEAVPTPTATPTPTPVPCDVATAITASSSTVTVAKGNSTEVTVTVTGVDGCRVVNDKVKATSNDTSIATVSPSKVTTDANGQATFTITGNEKGSARVKFRESTANLKIKVSVKVVK